LRETEEALKSMKGITEEHYPKKIAEKIHPDTSARPFQQSPVLILRFKYDD